MSVASEYHFDDLESFLRDRRGGFGQDQLPEAHLCSLLGHLYYPGGSESRDPTSPHKAMTTPWVTLVLGSEVLDTLPERPSIEDFKGSASEGTGLAGQLAAQLQITDQEADLTADFAWNLLLDRSSFQNEDHDGDTTDTAHPVYEPLVLRLIQACAALTTVYFFTKAALQLPVSANEDQPVGTRDSAFSSFTTTERGYWQRAFAAMDALDEALRRAQRYPAPYWKALEGQATSADEQDQVTLTRVFDETQWEPVRQLCCKIRDKLDLSLDAEPPQRPDISSRDCRIITQITWFYLVESLRPGKEHISYPDWDELLVAVGVTPSKRAGHIANDNASLFQYEQALEAITRLLDPVTVQRNHRLWDFASGAGKVAEIERQLAELTTKGEWKKVGELANQREALQATSTQSAADAAFATYANLVCAQSDVAAYAYELDVKRAEISQQGGSAYSLSSPATTNKASSKDMAGIAAAFFNTGSEEFTFKAPPPADPAPAVDRAEPTHVMPGELRAQAPLIYVSTLDIQTELAMWYHDDPRPFLVVLPIDVVVINPLVRGQAAWIGYVVDPRLVRGTSRDSREAALQAIQHPAPNSFFLLDQDDWRTVLPRDIAPRHCLTNPDTPPEDIPADVGLDLPYADKQSPAFGSCMPIIVKLCGSPLVELPKLPGDPRKLEREGASADEVAAATYAWEHLPSTVRAWDYASNIHGFGAYIQEMRTPDKANTRDAPKPEFFHRIILDEHQAIEAALREVSSITDVTPPREKGTDYTNKARPQPLQRLPRDFTVSSEDFWRYWVLLGVSASNAALRYRTIGQLIRAWFETATAVPYEKASILTGSGGRLLWRLGVAVNRQPIGKAVRDLLEIDECDTLTTDPCELTDELADYTAHLRIAVDNKPFMRNGLELPADTSTWDPNDCIRPRKDAR